MITWDAVPEATRYRVARKAAAYSVITTTALTTVKIQWITGISEYRVFAVFPSGEAMPSEPFWTSR